MLPSLLSAQVTHGIRDFLRASFWSNSPGFDSMIERMLTEQGSLLRGPYISLKLPFRRGEVGPKFFPNVPMAWPPHMHQERAFERLGAKQPRSTIVATGTGSGKTESFLLPILNHCIQNAGTKGIKAILIYPMNALATDQATRLAALIHGNAEARGKVTAGLFIGQPEENPSKLMSADRILTDRMHLTDHPPDILLTNYKMLDYLLMRPDHARLWRDNLDGQVLKYLVVDELHTFDGAQGTDLACLIRRLKDRLQIPDNKLCCIGTSATLGSDASGESLLGYASQVFGEVFDEDAIVGEVRLSREEFLAGRQRGEFFKHPTRDELATLRATGYIDEIDYIRASVAAWFEQPLEFDGKQEWRIALGELLGEHLFFSRLLGKLDGKILELDALIQELDAAHPSYRKYSREDMEWLVTSFLALISVARAPVSETSEQRAERERAGKPRATLPFLQVQLQLWQRELRRMVASVEDVPRLTFVDDLTAEQREQHLPAVYCPSCALMGWASLVREGQHHMRAELRDFYTAFFSYDSRVNFFFPHEAVSDGVLHAVDSDSLVFELLQNLPKDLSAEDRVITRRFNPVKGQPGSKKLSQDCPRCGANEALTLIGFRAATLTSTFIDQLYASRFNDHKKLLTFSDSVQDAAHRAGFFGARTWRFTFRSGLQQALLSFDDPPDIEQLAGAMRTYWEQRLGKEDFVATFIPPELEPERDYEHLIEKGKLPSKTNLPDLVERRLGWEILLDYSLRAARGRALPSTGASAAGPSIELLTPAIDRITELLPNKVGFSSPPSRAEVERFVSGVLWHILERGGILGHRMPADFVDTAGVHTYKSFVLDAALPNYGPRSMLPILPTSSGKPGRFENIGASSDRSWYKRWFERSLGTEGRLLGQDHLIAYEVVFAELVRAGVFLREDKSFGPVWGFDPGALLVHHEVRSMRCDTCARELMIPVINAPMTEGAACLSSHCSGQFQAANLSERAPGSHHYRDLYNRGDVLRVVTAEHTGLLDRDTRQDVERRFKKKTSARWEPNLLSCTPTLEMGIDIGDLSTAILCSIPPAQANYLQRVGRAGRRDGNALVIALAGAKPHDLYFFEDPLDMIDGDVKPPGVYLNASAVLERQLTAYCFDRWISEKAGPKDLPSEVKDIFDALANPALGKFPHDFLNFVVSNQTRLLANFLAMFASSEVHQETREALEDFMLGTGTHAKSGNLHWKILNCFELLKRERDDLDNRVKKSLDRQIAKLEAKPILQDSEKEALKQMQDERGALLSIIQGINKTRTLEHLTDHGLIPNYAFPEQGVTLRSIIWRKSVGAGKYKYERTPYEYVRPAARALSELAPNNSFYAEGYQVTIDQVDVTSSDAFETWRFCGNCDHAERIDQGDHHPSCPACGERDKWSDRGQRRQMLRLRKVFASAEDRRARIRDDSDDRSPKFYTRQMLVEIEETGNQPGWFLDNDEIPFGFEYVRRVVMRDINFGEHNDIGKEVTIGGVGSVRDGFKICKECGKVQDRDFGKRKKAEEKHDHTCPAKAKKDGSSIEACLYLYRELRSEAVRVLLPFLDDIGADRARHSFLAAFQMGLEDFFRGNIDHLNATVYSEPSVEEGVRKQFLMLHDTIPGGTGYLKELVRDPDKVMQILVAARDRLRSCACNQDAEKDGCYRCLFAYRNSYEMAETSRDMALEILTKILRQRQTLTRTEALGDIRVNALLDSHLEAMFIESLRRHKVDGNRQGANLTNEIIRGHLGYRFTVGDVVWEIQPQVNLGLRDGVAINCRPDFIFWPVKTAGDQERLPVAVFTDGWKPHRDRITDDFAKRMAILRSGNFLVWSLDYHDVHRVLTGTSTPSPWLRREWRENSKLINMARGLAQKYGEPVQSHFFNRGNHALLLDYLLDDKPLSSFENKALAIAHSIFALDPGRASFDQLLATTIPGLDPRLPVMFHSMAYDLTAKTSSAELSICVGKRSGESSHLEAVDLAVILQNGRERRQDADFRDVWHGLLGLQNVLQFLPNALFLASDELDQVASIDWLASAPAAPEDDRALVLAALDPDVRERWELAYEETIEEAESDILNLVLFHHGPPPTMGYALLDEKSRPSGLADIGWPEQKVAVSFDKIQRDELRSRGWNAFLFDDVITNQDLLTSAFD